MNGTGWYTADADGVWRPGGDPATHAIAFGLHFDRFNLDSQKFNTTDWLTGSPGTLATASRGDTETEAAYLQDVWTIDPDLKLTTGVRVERWEALNGFNYSLEPGPVREPAGTVSHAHLPQGLAGMDAGRQSLAANRILRRRLPLPHRDRALPGGDHRRRSSAFPTPT